MIYLWLSIGFGSTFYGPWLWFNVRIAEKIKVLKLHFAPHFYDFLCPHSFIHSISLSFAFFFHVTDAPWKPVFYYLIFPVYSAPCRIQWHSFLMSLLSLLISVGSGEMNDSRPCHKYNMRCINFSENKNGRLPLLIPFQMFRFMAFSRSASFSNFVAEIYFHLINEQLRKRGVYSQNLHAKGHIFDESPSVCVYWHV